MGNTPFFNHFIENIRYRQFQAVCLNKGADGNNEPTFRALVLIIDS